MSFDVILPFLRPIVHLIQDPDVSEIMINAGVCEKARKSSQSRRRRRRAHPRSVLAGVKARRTRRK